MFPDRKRALKILNCNIVRIFCTKGDLTVKKTKGVVFGAAALCVGMLGVAGCSNQVMGQREFVPDASSPGSTPMESQQVVPMPPAQQQPALQQRQTAPRQVYAPMEKVASAPVSKVPAGVSTSATAGKAAATHVIKAGDTVGHLAKQYGVSTAAIMQANNLDEAKAKRLRIGQKLVIPATSGAVKLDRGGKSGKTSVTGSAAVKGGLNADGTYTVQSGDFPGKIARKLGVKETELMKANNLTYESAKRIRVGQKLVVPGKSSGVAAVSTAPAKKQPVKPAEKTPVVVDQPNELDATLNSTDVPANAGSQVNPVSTGAAGAVADIVVGDETPIDITEDTTVEAFAAKYNTTVDKLKELNSGLIPADGKLTKGLVLFVPPQQK